MTWKQGNYENAYLVTNILQKWPSDKKKEKTIKSRSLKFGWAGEQLREVPHMGKVAASILVVPHKIGKAFDVRHDLVHKKYTSMHPQTFSLV